MSRTDLVKENKMVAVCEVMTRDFESIAPEASVLDATRLMNELNVASLPVCHGELLVGMITERDISLHSAATGRAPRSTAVAEVMSAASAWSNESDPVDEVLKKMNEQQIVRMPVVNARRHLVGIVSLGDLAPRRQAAVERTLRNVTQQSEPAHR